ncbi:hypothetical protein DEU31_1894 [Brachybacterium sp. AG952]|uniref:hypothetical protein n=1 Tax=Brachybacterium sp. AG952 TaxID=2183989 RepID=UPI0010E2FB5A|nr:hypothetical protein [Brachybacterium sp. AG952]TDP78440.1 hypothetical protein DEU31_1894 [Brachybacterium sp. AG952]
MTAKTDGFGLEHRAGCKQPRWGIAEVQRSAGAIRVHRCQDCGLIWRRGDAAGPPRPRAGYERARR